MKTLYKFFIMAPLLGLSLAHAQKKVGIGTNSPKAALDISSTTNGLIMPSVATASKPAITANNVGALVYVNNEPMKSFWYAEKNSPATWKQWLFSDNVSNFNDPSISWVKHGNKGFGLAGGFLGTNDGVELSLKTNNTTAMRIETNQNTNINQKLFVSNVPVNNQATNGTIKFIGIDNTTKEVVQLAKTGDGASLFYVPFEINKGATTNVQITDYDTKIPAADYFVTLANKSVSENANGGVMMLDSGTPADPLADPVPNRSGDYFLPIVNLFQSGGTWHLSVSYGSNLVDGLTNCGTGSPNLCEDQLKGMTASITNIKWKIGLLVFNKQIINNMAPININMNNLGTNTQAAPAGL